MMILPALDDDTVNAIKMGLPSYEILGYVTTAVIKHPRTDDFIVLKWRRPWVETAALTEDDFSELNDRRTWDADWSDLIGKNIVVNPSILNTDARKALTNLK